MERDSLKWVLKKKETLKEANLILDALKENGFEIRLIEGVTFIGYPNDRFKPDNGENPLICCTLEHFIVAVHNK